MIVDLISKECVFEYVCEGKYYATVDGNCLACVPDNDTCKYCGLYEIYENPTEMCLDECPE